MINNMFMKDYDTFMKELKEGKIEHPEDWTTIDVEKARMANMDDFAKLIFDKKAREDFIETYEKIYGEEK